MSCNCVLCKHSVRSFSPEIMDHPIISDFTGRFRTNRLEDVVFIVLHIYLVVVSTYALVRESIPHT